MKRFLLIFSVLFVGQFIFSQNKALSDAGIYSDVVSSFKTGFYPGTIEKVNLLERKYPASAFLISAQVYKGESQICLKNYEDAKKTLEEVLNNLHSGAEDFTRVNFLLGKVYFVTKDYSKSLNYLYKACEFSIKNEDKLYYDSAIYYAAKIFFIWKDYQKAADLFTYVVSHGKSFSVKDYEESIQKLMICWNETENFENTVDLYEKLSPDSFSSEIYVILSIYTADALQGLKSYNRAYGLYCYALENSDRNIAVITLKKAYLMAMESDSEIDADSVFEKAKKVFQNNPSMLDEFWIRLGMEKYSLEDYKSAQNYFYQVSDRENPIVLLYETKIKLDTRKSDDDILELENLLKKLSEVEQNGGFENYTNSLDTYNSLRLQIEAIRQNWEVIPEIYEKISSPTQNDIYLNASAYYKKSDFEESLKLLGKNVSENITENNRSFFELYASNFARLGKYNEAMEVFKKLENAGKFSEKSTIDYMKVLFRTGNYEKTVVLGEALASSDALFLSGVSHINLRHWKSAVKNLETYIDQTAKSSDFNDAALFYKAYAQYNLENYKLAQKTFSDFADNVSENNEKYRYKAYEFAAKAALQSGDLRKAAEMAENLIRFSEKTEDKQQATLFASEIYADSKNYIKAISLLKSYAESENPFAIQANFQIARIYIKQNLLSNAEKTYETIAKKYPDTSYGEEAMYRIAELYYSNEDYNAAGKHFGDYMYRYVDGIYGEAAYFFCGDSYFRLKSYDKAIMLNEDFLRKYPDSVYVYGACKNLLSAYYEVSDYEKSLNTARKMMEKFSSQARDDGVSRRILELERIISGSDTKIVEKLSQFEKAGGIDTKAGRKWGSELVQMYAASSETQVEAYSLALDLLEQQNDYDEMLDAAKNAEFVAEFYRKRLENEKSAQMYLKAAEYYRMIEGQDESAARTLYGAAEAFVSADKKGDGKETAKLLQKLYPQSVQAHRVLQIVK